MPRAMLRIMRRSSVRRGAVMAGPVSQPASVAAVRHACVRRAASHCERYGQPYPKCLSVRRPESDPRVNGLVERSNRHRCSPIGSKRATTHRRTDQLSRSRHRWTAEGSPRTPDASAASTNAPASRRAVRLTGADPWWVPVEVRDAPGRALAAPGARERRDLGIHQLAHDQPDRQRRTFTLRTRRVRLPLG